MTLVKQKIYGIAKYLFSHRQALYKSSNQGHHSLRGWETRIADQLMLCLLWVSQALHLSGIAKRFCALTRSLLY